MTNADQQQRPEGRRHEGAHHTPPPGAETTRGRPGPCWPCDALGPSVDDGRRAMHVDVSRHPSFAGLVLVPLLCAAAPGVPTTETVRSIGAPKNPLPSEAASASTTRFSFIAYGDTRGRRDGKDEQYEHSLVMDSILA